MSDPMGLLALIAIIQAAQGLEQPAAKGQPGPPGPPGGTMPPNGGGIAPGPMPAAAPTSAPGPSTAPVTPAPSPAPSVAPGGAPPMPPWPQGPVPADLPPFPGPGWTPDLPETDAVKARAAYWNQFLWDQPRRSIVRKFVQENFGGQWVTFAAAWHAGDQGAQTFMATEAWRLATAPPVVPSSGPSLSVVQAAAQNMNNALSAHGYKQADQPLYKAFQAAASLSPVDGFPGTKTMLALANVLKAMGTSMAPVKVYPWSSRGAYDGVNAPTVAEWTGASAPVPTVAPAAAAPAAGPMPGAPGPVPAPVSPYPGPGAWKSNAAYVRRYQTALQWLALATGNPAYNPQGIDGDAGTKTMNAVHAFQADHGLTQDGEAGKDTAAAIDAAVAAVAAHGA